MEQLVDATDVPSEVKSDDQRKAVLARRIAHEASYGARIQSQGDYQAIMVFGQRPNHLLHFFIGLFTLGIWWLFVWLPMAFVGGEKRVAVRVDQFGNTFRDELLR